ncbi:response regulator [Sulfurimonas sp. MAG313]|nr:response regulator [Sulfurimonas sp. MAG313]MDF1881113.1 response regulator [Sulfurimonas sp. MAG313]
MNILIVDDNANNRMVLKLMLQDYGEEKNAVYDIVECENGLEAVNKANRADFDIIFMDIMMPEMNGIEATKKIRARNKEVMIIAVSAVDDELQQKEILRNGAEDYVPKPIDIKLLNARLDSYFSLLKLRAHGSLSAHRKAANLYSNEILKRQTIFYVSDEEALAEFWEYYLLRDVSQKIDGLSDVVRATFAVGEAIISLKGEPWIIVEGDNDAIYFTINRIDVVGEMVIKLIMKKNKEIKDFKYNEEKLCFKLLKEVSPIEEESPKKKHLR